MRTLKLGLATLATSAAVFMPVGAATANPLIDVNAPVYVCSGSGGCANYILNDFLNGNNTNICPGLAANVIGFAAGNDIDCQNGKTAKHHPW